MKHLILILLLLLCAADAPSAPLPRLIPYRDGDKWGYCDSAGIVKIPPQWDEADFFCGDKAVVKINGNTGFGRDDASALIDTAGRYIIPPSWHWNRQWSGWKETGLNVHNDSNRYGLVDTNGHILIPFEYDAPNSYSLPLSAGFKVLAKDGRFGLISAKNEVLIPFQYQYMSWLAVPADSMPLFKVGQDGHYGVIDGNGKELLPLQYSNIENYPATDRNRHPYRSGLMLYQKALVDRHDSSKGIRDLYGWTDYTAKLLIPPKYKWLNWVSERYYVGDERLYGIDQKRVLPKSYFQIYRSGDTVFASRKGRSRKARVLIHRHAFRASDLSELSVTDTWQMIPGRDNHANRFFCGGVHDPDAERIEQSRPSVLVDGKYQKRFQMGSIFWTAVRRLGDGNVAIQGYDDSHRSYNAAITNTGVLMTNMIQSKGQIVGFNPSAQILIWEQDGRYGLSGTSGTIITPLQDKIISDAFYDDGRTLYTVLSEPITRDRYSGESEAFRPLHAGANPRLCYEDGTPVRAFRSYNFIETVGKEIVKTGRYMTSVKVADSTGRQAIMRLNGDTLLPAISFQYKEISAVTPDLFLVLTATDRMHLLVNSHNKDLLPGADVQQVYFLREGKQTHTEVLYDQQIVKTALMIAHYRLKKDDGTTRSVFMNEHGRVYAGKL